MVLTKEIPDTENARTCRIPDADLRSSVKGTFGTEKIGIAVLHMGFVPRPQEHEALRSPLYCAPSYGRPFSHIKWIVRSATGQ